MNEFFINDSIIEKICIGVKKYLRSMENFLPKLAKNIHILRAAYMLNARQL